MAALRDDALTTINLDIPTTVDRILAALPRLREVEAQVLLRWRNPPAGQLDRLQRYAAPLLQAHTACQTLNTGHPDVSSIASELARVRQHLLCCTHALLITGLLTEASLAPYQRARAYRSLALFVCGIVNVCRAQWHAIVDRTPLSLPELDRADQLAQRLLHELRARRMPPEALRQRRQAFTLLLREYTELRRAARFLYSTREAEQRVPSLFRNGRRGRLR